MATRSNSDELSSLEDQQCLRRALPDLETFREQLSSFLDRELTETIRRQQALDMGLGDEGRAFSRAIGAHGWLGAGWPVDYGGSGGGIDYEFVLVNEFAKRGAMIPNTVARFMGGPVLLKYGSEALKHEFVPRICRGEIEFALGYTEPSAGSDLAAMSMKALDLGEHYEISGQKVFQTECHYADYHWLAARTDPHGGGHNGISLFIVDQRAEGIAIYPESTLGGERVSTVFYDKVVVPKQRMVGTAGRGFHYLMEALDYERVMMLQNHSLLRPWQNLVQHAKSTWHMGVPLSADAGVRRSLAQLSLEIDVALSLERHAQALLRGSRPLDYVASVTKLFGSELRQRLAYNAIDIIGGPARLDRDTPGAPVNGDYAHMVRASVLDTIGAGTSEILRNIIATRGLGLPRN